MNNQNETGGGLLPSKNCERKVVGSGGGFGQLARRYWKAPFRYDAEGSMIWDANGERALDIRGWGYLSGGGEHALGLSYSDAAKIQDDFGQAICALLNTSWPNNELRNAPPSAVSK